MKKILNWIILQWVELCWNTFDFRYKIKSKILKLYYGNKLKFFDEFDNIFYFDINDCDKFSFEEFNEEYENGNILPYDGEILTIQLDKKFTNIYVKGWGGFIHNGKFDDYIINYEKLKELFKKYEIIIYWANN